MPLYNPLSAVNLSVLACFITRDAETLFSIRAIKQDSQIKHVKNNFELFSCSFICGICVYSEIL